MKKFGATERGSGVGSTGKAGHVSIQQGWVNDRTLSDRSNANSVPSRFKICIVFGEGLLD